MQAVARQYVRNNISPFNNRNNVFVAQYFGQFVAHKSWIWQAVKVKMVDVKLRCVVNLTNRKGWAAHFIFTASAVCQAPHKRSLAATEVAYKFDNLTAL